MLLPMQLALCTNIIVLQLYLNKTITQLLQLWQLLLQSQYSHHFEFEYQYKFQLVKVSLHRPLLSKISNKTILVKEKRN
jgi:hypothetical protein